MLLEQKTAVVYGAGGPVGGAVARAFAAEGAHVVLAGRTQASLAIVATDIAAATGSAETAIVDALDREAIERNLADIVARTGRIDISFNAIDSRDVQGKPLVEMDDDEFVRPVDLRTRSNFLTGTAAARWMVTRRAGVIMTISARPDLLKYVNTGGFGVSCAAVESLCRQLAIELGPEGIRVVCLRSAGSPDARGVREVFELHARNEGISFEAFSTRMGAGTLLKRLPMLAEVANAAVLMASDRAGAMTAVIANVTCGEITDW